VVQLVYFTVSSHEVYTHCVLPGSETVCEPVNGLRTVYRTARRF
jgi:hypothetical protein